MAQAIITRRKGGGGVNVDLPAQVTAFTATADNTPSITLSWINPTEYWAGTLIVKKVGSAPEGVNDGEKVYNGTGTTFTDTAVEYDVTYFYRAFPYNEKKQYQTLFIFANATPKKEIVQPLYTGNYTVAEVGEYVEMHLLTSGTLTIQDDAEYDLFCVGGGGGGTHNNSSSSFGGGGGGGGYTNTLMAQALKAGDILSVLIGAGGVGGGCGYYDSDSDPKPPTSTNGGATSIGSLLSANGGKYAPISKYSAIGGAGGSGGGGGQSTASYPGTGGSDGSNGVAGKPSNSHVSGSGGKGQGTTTRAFGESNNTILAGGGGGGRNGGTSLGGEGGGGNGGSSRSGGYTKGTTNTGGGGGGCYGTTGSGAGGADGGSGIAIIRWKKDSVKGVNANGEKSNNSV